MDFGEVEQMLSTARVIYQVKLAGDKDQLINGSNLELTIHPPGCQGPDEVCRPDLWSVGLSEHRLYPVAVCTGATLAEAFTAMRKAVDERCVRLREMLASVSR